MKLNESFEQYQHRIVKVGCKCINWCRTDGQMTNHHPACTHYNDSLIDVWKVTDGSTCFYTDDKQAADTEAEGCDDITITKVKMHREVFDLLPEFEGF